MELWKSIVPKKAKTGTIEILSSKNTKISVTIDGDTIWLSQTQMIKLFQSSKSNVSEDIKHVFEEDELEESSVVRKFRTTGSDGKIYTEENYDQNEVTLCHQILNT